MKIILERENCSICGTCWETCPDIFEQNQDDSFTQIVEKFRIDGNIAKGKPPVESEDCADKAAELCCADVIRIERD
ncbi:MAG: ferredoxin [Methanoregula sp.]|nr:ferredoxin [Methanoregula sp.]